MPEPLLQPGGGDPSPFGEALRRQARTGIPIHLDLDALRPEEASGALDLFLHDPQVTSPIEPFAALLGAMIRKQELGLWDLGSARLGAPKVRETFLMNLPREHPGCLECACFPVCQGYGAWAGSCTTWRALLPVLAGAARELSALRRGNLRRPERRDPNDQPT
jgi:hypothetical protein